MVVASAAVLAIGVAACGSSDDDATGSGSGDLSGTIRIDGSSTVGPAHRSDRRAIPGRKPGRQGDGRHLRHRRRLRKILRRRDRHQRRLARNRAGRGRGLQEGGHRLRGRPRRDRRADRDDQQREPGQLPHRRSAERRLGPRLEDLQLERNPRPQRGIRRGRWRCSARAPTRARSTTSPKKSTAKRARRARTTTTSARTTTPPSPASRARPAAWATPASPTTRRTKASSKRWKSTTAKAASARRSKRAQDGSYTPLSRPLFIYPSDAALKKPEVKAFVDYYLENVNGVAESVGFVPLTEEQLEESEAAAEKAGA